MSNRPKAKRLLREGRIRLESIFTDGWNHHRHASTHRRGTKARDRVEPEEQHFFKLAAAHESMVFMIHGLDVKYHEFDGDGEHCYQDIGPKTREGQLASASLPSSSCRLPARFCSGRSG